MRSVQGNQGQTDFHHKLFFRRDFGVVETDFQTRGRTQLPARSWNPFAADPVVGLVQEIERPPVHGHGVIAPGDVLKPDLAFSLHVLAYSQAGVVADFFGWSDVRVVVTDAQANRIRPEEPLDEAQPQSLSQAFPHSA